MVWQAVRKKNRREKDETGKKCTKSKKALGKDKVKDRLPKEQRKRTSFVFSGLFLFFCFLCFAVSCYLQHLMNKASGKTLILEEGKIIVKKC